MNISTIGSSLVSGNSAIAIPVLKKAIETQENLVGRIFEDTLRADQNHLPEATESIEQVKHGALEKGSPFDIHA